MVETRERAEQLPKYRIGTVVQITGLTADTIRAWERRYETVAPSRTSGGTRLYSDADVSRLQLMRALTEAGHPIGSIAGLADAELRRQLARFADTARDAGGQPVPAREGPLRTAVLDATLPEQIRWNGAESAGLELVLASDTLARFLDDLRKGASGESASDVLVLHLSLLGAQPLEALSRCLAAAGAEAAIVVYDFASRRLLAKLAASGACLIRGPVSVDHLRRSVLDRFAIQQAASRRGDLFDEPPGAYASRLLDSAPARIFSDSQIARLREIVSRVDCECPTHLAQIVSSLAAFEAYSQGCEAASPEDAALHRALASGTGHARALVEQMLAKLCRHDGIHI